MIGKNIKKNDKGVIIFFDEDYNDYIVICATNTDGSGGTIVVDDELSNTSENPVQNKIITGALTNKSNLNHTHNYSELNNKPSYTPTITSSTYGAYEIGKINVSGSNQIIYGKDTGGSGGSVIGTGSFSINENGHLIVELPEGVDNPYFINENGHLIYDTSNPHNEGEIQ